MTNKNSLPRSLPETQGVSSSSILSFIEALKENNIELHSFMLVRHGYVVAESWWSPYSSELPHMLFSLSKSSTSTAIGLAVEEGLISIEDKVISFFPEDIPKQVDENLAKLRIKHLLSMSTGHATDTTDYVVNQKDGNWVKAFLELPIEYEPGTFFVYNTAATYMLSAIIQKITGKTLLNYLTPRLFEPLSIEGATWETCPRGINTGGFGLSIKTEDIAKFGQLYLQKGQWKGKTILSDQWILEATSSHISNGTDIQSDWSQGYGYQFWRCKHGAYRGDGAFGQYCIVMPDQDVVIAITSGVDDMQVPLNLIWKHLLPAMGTLGLIEDLEMQLELKHKLSNLELPPPMFEKGNESSSNINNKHYKMSENELGIQSLSFIFQDNFCTLKLGAKDREFEINCGIENWLKGTFPELGLPPQIVASGTWSDSNTFIITFRFIETPFYYTLRCNFKDEVLDIEVSVNVAFGPKELPTLHGSMID